MTIKVRKSERKSLIIGELPVNRWNIYNELGGRAMSGPSPNIFIGLIHLV